MEETIAVAESEEEFLKKVIGDSQLTAEDVKRLYPKHKKFGRCPKCRKKLGSPQNVADHLNEGAHMK